ncbi:hypothetical protein [Acinetobacter seifertii]|uniref:hypothetical protein n=1 Tax=Acinetobacter seifertii TaxID=1530123 RepID=UPI003F5244A4
MENYKIKVKDEAESKEAQELFFELGYAWINSGFDSLNIRYTDEPSLIATVNGISFCGDMSHFHKFNAKELTLPQLHDLVVLKRNDPKDANYTYCGKPVLKLETQDYKVWNNLDKCWAEHLGSQTDLRNGIKKIEKAQGLISGAEAYDLIGKRIEVEAYCEQIDGSYEWQDAKHLPACDILNDGFDFRLKPQTIKLDLEIPAPFKAKIGGRDDTSFVLNVGRHQYLYQNEDDYTKARNALEAVFDAALGGNNS